MTREEWDSLNIGDYIYSPVWGQTPHRTIIEKHYHENYRYNYVVVKCTLDNKVFRWYKNEHELYEKLSDLDKVKLL